MSIESLKIEARTSLKKAMSMFAFLNTEEELLGLFQQALHEARKAKEDARKKVAERKEAAAESAVIVTFRPADSECIEFLNYDYDARRLIVRFKSSKALYAYSDVPSWVFIWLKKAESVGKEFNLLVRGTYKATKLEPFYFVNNSSGVVSTGYVEVKK